MNKNLLIVLALIIVLSVVLVEVNAQFFGRGYGGYGRGGYGGYGRGGYGGFGRHGGFGRRFVGYRGAYNFRR